MNLKDLIDRKECAALSILNHAGYQSYLVGGCVRDALMGREINDVDITTDALPQETKYVFDKAGYKTLDIGIKHGTITVLMDHEPVEITTFRTEGEYSDNRHPDKVDFVKNVEADLARRDFTMNAIAVDRNGQIVDPFGGREDIDNQIIRAVGDPVHRFEEDALRIMRAIRFAAQLGFEIEPRTDKAIFQCCSNLQDISRERIFAEFKKLVLGQYAGQVVDKYIEVLGVIMPLFQRLDGFEQHNPHHKYDVLRHCIKCMENLQVTDENRQYMRIAGLFHDIGKPDTFAFDEEGIGHCFGHPEAGAVHVEKILRDLKADNFTIQRVTLLVKYHDLLFHEDEKLLKKWLRKFGPEVVYELLEIKRADNLAIGCDVSRLITMFDNVKVMLDEIIQRGDCYEVGHLAVNGADVMECCHLIGPDVGKVLEGLLQAVVDNRVANERAPLLKEAMLIKSRF